MDRKDETIIGLIFITIFGFILTACHTAVRLFL